MFRIRMDPHWSGSPGSSRNLADKNGFLLNLSTRLQCDRVWIRIRFRIKADPDADSHRFTFMWSRSNVVLELFAQIINESCYDQLRTKVCILPTPLLEPSVADPESGAYLIRIIAGSPSHPCFWELGNKNFGLPYFLYLFKKCKIFRFETAKR